MKVCGEIAGGEWFRRLIYALSSDIGEIFEAAEE
jgi:hypothetical protein